MASDMRQLSSNRGRTSESKTGSFPKILQGKCYLLDIENRQSRTKVAEAIQNCGGNILDSFGDKDPHCVVSDHSMILTCEKKGGDYLKNEQVLKALPALVRQAHNRGIKIRTPELFLKQMNAYLSKSEKATSATTSHSTMRPRTSLKYTRENSIKVDTPAQNAAPPRTSRTNSSQSSSVPKEDQAFLRIDVPSRRPDIRLVPKSTFNTMYAGTDAGHSIFKQAEIPLKERRRKEYDLFTKGRYEPAKKPFKLDDKDNYCQFCQKQYTGERREHERTDEHRSKARTQGITPILERAILTAKLNLKYQKDREMRNLKRVSERAANSEMLKRANVEFEYGENVLLPNWQTLRNNNTIVQTEKIRQKASEKAPVISPRRRQQRIQPRVSQDDFF